jgi:hypothetical protein
LSWLLSGIFEALIFIKERTEKPFSFNMLITCYLDSSCSNWIWNPEKDDESITRKKVQL